MLAMLEVSSNPVLLKHDAVICTDKQNTAELEDAIYKVMGFRLKVEQNQLEPPEWCIDCQKLAA